MPSERHRQQNCHFVGKVVLSRPRVPVTYGFFPQELAGYTGGDVSFIKEDFELQLNKPLALDSVSLRPLLCLWSPEPGALVLAQCSGALTRRT